MGSCMSKETAPAGSGAGGNQTTSQNRGQSVQGARNNRISSVDKQSSGDLNKNPASASGTLGGPGTANARHGSSDSKSVGKLKDHNDGSDSSNDDSTRYNEKHNSFANNNNGSSNLTTALNTHNTGVNAPINSSPNDNALNKEVKVLLLGSGESGKSTIVKQMKILHQNGYSKDELLEYKPYVYRNALECIKMIINAIIDLNPALIHKHPSFDEDKPVLASDSTANGEVNGEVNGHISDADVSEKSVSKGGYEGDTHFLPYNDLNEILDYEININSDETFNPAIAKKIDKIYHHPKVQEFIKYHQGEFYLIDSTHYFLSDIFRICKKNYIPNTNDILRTRKKTSGIYDFKFQMGSGLNIHMFDVGGQRSERKKWIHCFDNVTLIIFCVALSEYDQVLLEENNQNRLEESLTLFDSVVNSRWFARTSIVLFLNKIDVFADKLPYSPLEKFFPDYTGGNNINKAAKYILWRFSQVNRSGLNIFPHVTQATDTSNIELVFVAVKETILENSLKDSGLL